MLVFSQNLFFPKTFSSRFVLAWFCFPFFFCQTCWRFITKCHSNPIGFQSCYLLCAQTGLSQSTIEREEMQQVDDADSIMWYAPLWILEPSALSLKTEQVIFAPSTAMWVELVPQGLMRPTRLRADFKGTPTAQGRQCKMSFWSFPINKRAGSTRKHREKCGLPQG